MSISKLIFENYGYGIDLTLFDDKWYYVLEKDALIIIWESVGIDKWLNHCGDWIMQRLYSYLLQKESMFGCDYLSRDCLYYELMMRGLYF